MPAGDLVTGDDQFELAGVLLGENVNSPWTVLRHEGIRSLPKAESHHTDRNDDHGGFPGPTILKPRWISLELLGRRARVNASPHNFAVLRKAFYPLTDTPGAYPTLVPFVFQLPETGKRYTLCRPEPGRFDFDVNPGAFKGHAAVWCPDPRLYSFTEAQTDIVIASGSTSNSATVAPGGDFNTPPVIEIGGPATNPRIASTALGRTMAFDLVLTAGQTLIVDVAKKTITLAGVDRFDVRRTDNQWWNLEPTDTVTVTRASGNTGASSTFRFKYRAAVL